MSPTSSLTSKEIDDLFRIIRKLKAEGCGIVYISHRLEELAHIVDRVTIMRDGQFITKGNFRDMTMDQIITNMVGREIKEQFPRVECKKGKKIFEVRNLNAGRMVRNINFSAYEGEIVGFAGLMGAGRTETTRAIFGVDPKESGEICVDGKEVHIRCPEDAIKNGVVLAPEDRKKDGLCTKLSIRHNLALPNLDLLCNKLGVVSSKKEDELCRKGSCRPEDQDAECGDRFRKSFRRKSAEGRSRKMAGAKFKSRDFRRADKRDRRRSEG